MCRFFCTPRVPVFIRWMCNFKSDYFVCAAISVSERICQFHFRLASSLIFIQISFPSFYLPHQRRQNGRADDRSTGGVVWNRKIKRYENIIDTHISIGISNSMSWNENGQMSIVWPIWKQPLSLPWNSTNFTILIYFNEGKTTFIIWIVDYFMYRTTFGTTFTKTLQCVKWMAWKKIAFRCKNISHTAYWLTTDDALQLIIFAFVLILSFRFYQLRCSLRVSPRLPVQIETSISECPSKVLSSASVVRGAGTSKIFQILYRNEEILLKDTVNFRVRLLGRWLWPVAQTNWSFF